MLPAMAPVDSVPPALDPRGRYRLDPDVALRPERFGALAYHYGSRRLTFLRSTLLADVVRTLDQHESLDEALAARVPPGQQAAFRRALAALAASDFIQPVPAAAS
jgi:putative mycofactocin binding protein MftB